VLGSEFVRVLDERTIDPRNVADYLVEAFDGFLDIIEIKRPGGGGFGRPHVITATAFLRPTL
jgi:hypothetical protein